MYSPRVLTNSKFGLFYSNFMILTPTFSKVPTEKYGKTPFFSGKQHFYSYFQNPSENSESLNTYIKPSDSERRAISSILTGANRESTLSAIQPSHSRYLPLLASASQPCPTHPRPEIDHHHLSQFNSQNQTKNSSFSIFSGDIKGGNVAVNIYKA